MSLNKRQWDILCKLQSSDRPLSARTLARMVAKHNHRANDRSFREMVARDLRDIQRLTGAIESKTVSVENEAGRVFRENVYSWNTKSPKLLVNSLSSAQAVGLGVLQKVGMGLMPHGLAKELEPLFQGIHGNQVFRRRVDEQVTTDVTDREAKAAEKKWLKKIAILPETIGFVAPDVSSGVEKIIHQALYDEQVIEMTYRTKQYLVKPLALLQRGVRRYLIGIARGGSGQPQSFSVGRIGSAKVVNIPDYASIPGGEDFDVQAFARKGLAHPVFDEDLLGTEIEIELWVDEGTYGWIKETPLEKNQTAKPMDDGYRLKVTTVLREELVFWILSMGYHVKVLAPKLLRNRVASDLRQAAGLYR